jgi:group I intron endonuclease
LLDNKAKSGIYQWTHNESPLHMLARGKGKIYVGSAINLKTRLSQYFNINHLERNKTSYICNALQVHGYSAFSLTIYEHINITNLDKKELIF